MRKCTIFLSFSFFILSRGADSVKLPRSMKIPTKAAALSLPMISLCFLTKLALWSLFDNGFTYIQSLKQVLHHINQVFHKIYIPLMSKTSFVIHLFLSFILISHFRFVFPTICHNCRTWCLFCRVALLPCYPESAPRLLLCEPPNHHSFIHWFSIYVPLLGRWSWMNVIAQTLSETGSLVSTAVWEYQKVSYTSYECKRSRCPVKHVSNFS